MRPLPSRESSRAIGAERSDALKRLAVAANFAHRWAKSSAGAAVEHAAAAGDALARARDLCSDGEWSRWVRANFDASLRTAQRYIRLARNWPSLCANATRVSPESQAEATRAIRRALFERERAAAAQDDDPTAGRHRECRAANHAGPSLDDAPSSVSRAAALAVAGLGRLAASLRSMEPPGDAAAGYFASRVEWLRDDVALDAKRRRPDGLPPQRLYFAEALGASRVKIGLAAEPAARLSAIQTACPHRVVLIGHVNGSREVESATHARLSAFHIGGEWFHRTPQVRALISQLLGPGSGASGNAESPV